MVVEQLDKKHQKLKAAHFQSKRIQIINVFKSIDTRENTSALSTGILDEHTHVLSMSENARIINFWNERNTSEFFIKVQIDTNITPYIVEWQLTPNNDNLMGIVVTTKGMAEKGKKTEILVSFSLDQIKSVAQYWHLMLTVRDHQDQKHIIITKSNWKTKIKLLPDGYRHSKKYKDEVIYPTIQSNMHFVIEARQITKYEQFKYIRRSWLAYSLVLIFLPLIRYLNIWVFFEKNATSAHENAWLTFKRMREMYPQRLIYYAITCDTKNKLNITDKNIIILGTWKYYFIIYLTKLLLSSETRYHVLGDSQFHRSMLVNKMSKKVHIFLQHGMNGIKDVPMFHYGHGQIDFLIAASNWEKELIVKEWHYPDNRVFVTGLPRWDELVPEMLSRNVITFMPTWQPDITNLTQNMFENTALYKTYKTLFESSQFVNYMSQNNIDAHLILHPKFLRYSQSFKKLKYVTINVSSDITTLISKSQILVTDYSSTAWDSLYLGRKVIFLRYADLHNNNGLNVNMIGTVVNDSASLIATLIESNDHTHNQLESYFEPKSPNNTQRVIEKLMINQKKFKIHSFTYLNRKLLEIIKRLVSLIL
ncbi:CDP-glycerol glycerophosphotransferase family protein [Leuconostoc carnosum]|uniref:CDP-glycerol glycerophosphotransferase family protein n=1 Tax=Leuconostoc carnosum TaxID=1252 RepID=UPI00160C5DFA|nr:CDP-glycerol glycerophosphotransferase family protein [Leuconostoc carnosum]MBB6432319.1 CDP-glycerol glycerophosphotransferase (TagB/SpsB family) [Leuconostoc carnosum]